MQVLRHPEPPNFPLNFPLDFAARLPHGGNMQPPAGREPKTLAEMLGHDVQVPTDDDQDIEQLSGPQFAKMILGSSEYRKSLINRIILGELPAQVECLLYHHAFGKPIERLEVEDKTPSLENVSKKELELRAAYLLDLARGLPEQEDDCLSSIEDERALPDPIIH